MSVLDESTVAFRLNLVIFLVSFTIGLAGTGVYSSLVLLIIGAETLGEILVGASISTFIYGVGFESVSFSTDFT